MDIQIKVCGITRESDLRALSLSGADYAGLIFHEPSPRYAGSRLSGRSAREMKGALRTVGVFVNAGKEKILSVVDRYGLDLVQLHGEESPAFCEMIRRSVAVIKAIPVSSETDLTAATDPFRDCCDFLLFDAKGPAPGGNGILFNWEKLSDYRADIPFFLSGGIGSPEIGPLKTFRHPGWRVVDVNSRMESSPGVKSIDLVLEFVNALKGNEKPKEV